MYDVAVRDVTSRWQAHRGSVRALCGIRSASLGLLLASVGDDAALRLWDPRSGGQPRPRRAHSRIVRAVCPVPSPDTDLIAIGGSDGTIRLWDPDPGDDAQTCVLEGHTGWVRALTPVALADRTLLISASGDRTVRLWDPEARICLAVIPVQRPATSLAVSSRGLNVCVGSEGGLVALRLNPYLFQPPLRATGGQPSR
ncbi:hypothetical protein ACFV80_27965 [Streptomyces sp. NPDC059862]|uniref:hypothetical protein n=1 Tax=Streptomyces sp. NPDC059862 TaxID=3346975 RepID=UPI00364C09EA